jgi:hypothetical protein
MYNLYTVSYINIFYLTKNCHPTHGVPHFFATFFADGSFTFFSIRYDLIMGKSSRSSSNSNSNSNSTGRSSSSSSGSANGGKPSYPVIQLSDFRMGLHTDQQSLILSEMTTARRKLDEDNQRLRDELEDARMMIRWLKVKLEHQQKSSIKVKAVGAGDSTVKGGLPGGYWKALDRAVKPGITRRGLFFGKNKHQPTKKEAFSNPSRPGRKTFDSGNKNRNDVVIEEDTTPKVIEFPSPQPDRPSRSRHVSSKSQQTNQKSHRSTPSAPKKSDMVDHLQREIFLMAAASSADYKQFAKNPREPQVEPEYYHDQEDKAVFEEVKRALRHSIMDQLEETAIPEGDEAEEAEEEDELPGSVMDQIAKTVIEEYSHPSLTTI